MQEKQKKYPGNLFALIIIVSIIICQDISAKNFDRKYQLGLLVGLERTALRDDLLSPLIYSGNKLPIHLFYKFQGAEKRHNLLLSFKQGQSKSSTDNEVNSMNIVLQYSYLRHIKSIRGGAIPIFIGITSDNFATFRQPHFYSSNWNSSSKPSYDIAAYIDLSLLAEYKIKENQKIDMQIMTPLFGYLVRAPYSLGVPDKITEVTETDEITAGEIFGVMYRSREFATINKYLSLTLITSYEIDISRFFNFRLNHNLTYSRFTQPLNTRTFSNSLGCSIIFTF